MPCRQPALTDSRHIWERSITILPLPPLVEVTGYSSVQYTYPLLLNPILTILRINLFLLLYHAIIRQTSTNEYRSLVYKDLCCPKFCDSRDPGISSGMVPLHNSVSKDHYDCKLPQETGRSFTLLSNRTFVSAFKR